MAGFAVLSTRSFLVVSSSLTARWTRWRTSMHYEFEYSLTCEGEEKSRLDLGLRFSTGLAVTGAVDVDKLLAQLLEEESA